MPAGAPSPVAQSQTASSSSTHPELQPAETLWPILDDPLVNANFEALAQHEAAVSDRCLTLNHATHLISAANFHWGPKPIKPI